MRERERGADELNERERERSTETLVERNEQE